MREIPCLLVSQLLLLGCYNSTPHISTPPSGPSRAIRGTATFLGPDPSPSPVTSGLTPEALRTWGNDIPSSEQLLITKGRIRNVLILLEGLPIDDMTPSSSPIVIEHCRLMMKPHVTVVEKGRPILFSKPTEELHEVDFITVDDEDPRRVDLGQGRIGYVFDKEKLGIRARCLIHTWEVAIIHVVNGGHFSITDASGEFHISRVPKIKCRVRAWHEYLGELTLEVDDQVSDEIKLAFRFPPDSRRSK